MAFETITDKTPQPWESIGAEAQQTNELVGDQSHENKAPGDIVQLRPGLAEKFGLRAGQRAIVVQADKDGKRIKVERQSDGKEFGHYNKGDLKLLEQDYDMQVPADGFGGILGLTTTMKRSAYLRMMREKMASNPEEMAAAAEPEEPSLISSIFGGDRKFIFQIGSRVLVLRFGSLWYAGSVTDLNADDGTYKINYDDGDEEPRVDPRRMMQFDGYEYEVDDHVEVQRFGTKYYKGIVEGKNKARNSLFTTYDVRYEDDDLESGVESARIRVSVGFIYNPQALRKIVPNRPRSSMTGAGRGTARRKSGGAKNVGRYQEMPDEFYNTSPYAGSQAPMKKPGKPLKAKKESADPAPIKKRSNSRKSLNKFNPDGKKQKDEYHGVKIGSTFTNNGVEGTVLGYSDKMFQVKYKDGSTQDVKVSDILKMMGLPRRRPSRSKTT